MSRDEIELRNRVEHLEQALLSLCSATLDLVSLVGKPAASLGDMFVDRNTVVKNAVDQIVQAAEIVSGEHAPRQ